MRPVAAPKPEPESAESIAIALARALDPCVLFEEFVGPADDWQREALTSPSRYVALLASRQAGKSSIAAAALAWTVRYTPHSLALCVAPSERQSRLIYSKARHMLRLASEDETAGSRRGNDSESRLRLSNGSELVALPANPALIQGYSAPAIIVVDEAQFVDDQLFLEAILPMLAAAPRSRIIALGKAKALKSGWFYRVLYDDNDDWHRIVVPASRVSRITDATLASFARMQTAAQHRREFHCVWTGDAGDDGAVFDPEMIRRAITADASPLFGPSTLVW